MLCTLKSLICCCGFCSLAQDGEQHNRAWSEYPHSYLVYQEGGRREQEGEGEEQMPRIGIFEGREVPWFPVKEQAWPNFLRDVLAGSLVGVVAQTLVAPVGRAKLLLQTQEGNIAIMGGHQKPYKGLFDCIARVGREEGLWSLWRGNGINVLRHCPSAALNFSLKDLYRTVLSSRSKEDSILSMAANNFIAGAAAGCSALVVVYPLDIAHTRLTVDIGRADTRQFKGISHFLNTIYRKDGMKGLYRGLPASIHGIMVHRSVYFGGFDTAKDLMMLKDSSCPSTSTTTNHQLPFWERWVAAQIVTTSAGLISYPLDTVRRRMMMQAGLEKRMYASTLECWRRIYYAEGVRSFYRGAISNVFRGTGAALILVLYDEAKHLVNWAIPNALEQTSSRFDSAGASMRQREY